MIHQEMNVLRNLIFGLATILFINLIILGIGFLFGIQEEFSEQIGIMAYSPYLLKIVFVVGVLPFIEEACFRLFLSLKKTHVLVSAALMFSFFISTAVLAVLKNDIENYFLFFSIVSFFLFLKGLIMFRIPILKGKPVAEQLTQLFQSHFKIGYYGSAIAFGLFHVLFFSLYSSPGLMVNILIFISYFLTGLVLSSVRINAGFFYAVILHGMVNGLWVLKYF